MALSKKFLAPLVLSFSMMASPAQAKLNVEVEKKDALQEKDLKNFSFSCDVPDLSNLNLPDRLERIMPANVFIRGKSLGELDEKKLPPHILRNRRPKTKTTLGSGFIVDPRGYILTNHHVVDKAFDLSVTFYNAATTDNLGQRVPVKVIGSDEKLDIAVLKVDMKSALPCVNLGDSEVVRRGDIADIVGNPFGKAFSFSRGFISHTKRSVKNILYDYFQTDGAINPGNSGGALYNQKGEVVGINTLILTRSGGSNGVGFAFHSNDARNIAYKLVRHGKIDRASLGIRLLALTPERAKTFKAEYGQGVLIARVLPGKAGHHNGLKRGDIILEMGGVKMKSVRKLIRKIASYAPNEKTHVKILRKGKIKIFDISFANNQKILREAKTAPAASVVSPAMK